MSTTFFIANRELTQEQFEYLVDCANDLVGEHDDQSLHSTIKNMTDDQRLQMISLSSKALLYIDDVTDEMQRLHELRWIL